MYKIILIDDEDEVREGIKRKTDWMACGFELVGDFDNGRDALDAVDSLNPDVVITDICMPFMDGLELTEYITERQRDVKVVIVTGYEDFDYAKQAIRLKVHDYLLKPINSEEFTGFLRNMKLELDENRRQKEDIYRLKHQLNQSLPLLRERFLERMISSRLSQDEIHRRFQYFQLALTGTHYVALVADIDDFTRDNQKRAEETDAELLRFAAFNIVQEIFEQDHQGIVFRTRDDKIAVILSGGSDMVNTHSQMLAEHARYSVEKYLRLTVTFGIGTPWSSLETISKSFQKALSALDYRFLLGHNQVISIDDLEYGRAVDHVQYHEWEQALLSAMKSGKTNQVAIVLQDWMDDLKSSGCSVNQCHGWFQRLLVSLTNLVQEIGFDSADSVEVLGENPFSHIATMKTMEEVRQWLTATCHRMILFFSEKRTHVTHSQMLQALAYIREHYNDEHCSLQQVCSHIYMSISYFSAMFKQHTGLTFVEYLTRFRLEKAKELLTVTQFKTYDIAARVGYNDPQYFSVIFKRNLGMTPKEYRSMRKKGIESHEA
jgi:two-component system response regulator YesN